MNIQSTSKQTKLVALVALLVMGGNELYAQQIEEVVVTAQKREQNIQDVGIAIKVLTGEKMENLGFDAPRDLMFQTPGLVVSYSVGSSLPNFALRGVGLNDFAANNSSPVAVHLDEVYQSYSALLNFGLFDMERVEVLKGPQGTLFGRNTTGGTVNFYSKKPTQEFESRIKGTYGRYKLAKVGFHVNGGLSDNVAGRISGFYKTQDEGPWHSRFLNRDLGKVDGQWGLRAQLNVKPSDNLEINVNIHGGREESEGAQYNILPARLRNADGTASSDPCSAYTDGSLVGGEADCVDLVGNQEPDKDPFTSSSGLPNTQELNAVGVNVMLNWELSNLTLTSIMAYDNLERFSTEDADGFPQIIVDDLYKNKIDQYSWELRLASNEKETINWLAGFIWANDEIDTPKQEFLGTDFPAAPGEGVNAIYKQETSSAAVFGNLGWWISDSLLLNSGLRYTYEERSFDGRTIATMTPPIIGGEGVPFDPDIVFASLKDKLTFNDVSWKLGLDYFLNKNWLYYATISKGFKSGGFNGNLAFSNDQLQPFDEETLIAYEVGMKGTLLDGSMQWNVAAFYYDYKDVILQINETVQRPDGTDFTVFRFSNGANAKVKGFESDVTWRLTDGFDIQVGFAYIDSELVNAKTGNENLNGSQLSYTPEWSANWLAHYQKPISDSMLGYIQFDGSYKGDQFGEVPNSPVSAIGNYTILNGRLGFEPTNQRWEVAIAVQNLTDEEYTQYVNDLFALGTVLKTAGYPRTYSIEFSYKWD